LIRDSQAAMLGGASASGTESLDLARPSAELDDETVK
jgi:hypothetical protein